jgi:Leucine-rich repeat (LRR) protein
LKNINFSANKIEDNDITPISKLPNLIEVNFPKNLFSTEQVVWLKAHLSPNIKSEVLSPFWIIDK